MQAGSLLVALQAVLISTSGVTAAQLRAGHLKVGDLPAPALAPAAGTAPAAVTYEVADPSGEVVPPASEETPVELTKALAIPPLGQNSNPPIGFVAKDGSGPCRCQGSMSGLDSCGELCCANSPYTATDPGDKWYYGNGGNGDTSNLCWAQPLRNTWAQLCADCAYTGGFAQCGEYSGKPSCTVTECQSYCEQDASCVSVSYTESRDPGQGNVSSECYLNRGDGGASPITGWQTYGPQASPVVAGEETPVLASPVLAPASEETPLELRHLPIPSLGQNSYPPFGYVAKAASGLCRCAENLTGLDSCGELCCENSPYTASDPDSKWYYGNGGNLDTSNLCWEREQPLRKAWAQLCVDCADASGFAQCGQYSGKPSCTLRQCQSFCEQDASCVSVSYTEDRVPDQKTGSECFLNRGNDGANPMLSTNWKTYGPQASPVVAEVPASEETPVLASPVVAPEVAPAVAEVPPASEETPFYFPPVVAEDVQELPPASEETPA